MVDSGRVVLRIFRALVSESTIESGIEFYLTGLAIIYHDFLFTLVL
jgi:hypothetical protein